MEDGRIGVRQFFAVLALLAVAIFFYSRPSAVPAVPPRAASTTAGHSATVAPIARRPIPSSAETARTAPSTNLVDRLQEIRARFRALAAEDPALALRMAKGIADETERKAALDTILDAWKHGDVAEAADRSGQTGQQLVNNIGIVLAQSDPALAVVWANELADAAGRTTILEIAAVRLLKSDPTAAMALGQQIADNDRANFYQGIFSTWAAYDTQAALDAAAALADAALRDAALQTIQSVAPVGIGAALGLDNGYPVVTQLMPGAAADLSGQLAVGDHIIAVGQGNGEFESVQGMSMQEIVGAVRGPPGSVVELAIIPADDPDSEPEYIVIQRGQILFQP